MKKHISFILVILMVLTLCLGVVGCKKRTNDSCTHKDDGNDNLCDLCGAKLDPATDSAEPEVMEYTVKFVTETGAVISTQTVKAGGYAICPAENPAKEGFLFTGWYNNVILWSFETNPVNSDLTLKAGWMQNEDMGDIYEPESPLPY